MISGRPFNSLAVRNANNHTIAGLVFVHDSPVGPCEAPKPFSVLESVVLDIPQKAANLPGAGPSRFSFVIIEGEQVYGTVALSETRPDIGTSTCAFPNGIIAPEGVPPVFFGDVAYLQTDGQNAPLIFESVAQAKAYTHSQEYQDLKRMLVSLELRPVK